jgi:ATP-binding cassette, subfamily A (ABC1), member 3
MSSGELQCCGSPLFLKKRYGAGYHLTIVKNSDSIDTQPITRLIKNRVTNAKMENAAGAEVSYSLPDEESNRFEALFSELETSKTKMGIETYGVSITTMEEVFLK